jgi:hypothetical protein
MDEGESTRLLGTILKVVKNSGVSRYTPAFLYLSVYLSHSRRQSENPETVGGIGSDCSSCCWLGPPTNARTAPQEPNAAKGPASLDMTRPLLLILLAHNAAASSLADITRVERTLTFPGWRELARETRCDYIKYGWSYGFETMQLKQCLHDGDRSHPCVVALDETKPYLSYPGWRSDAAQAEMARHPMCWSLPHRLESTVAKMKRKQEYHEACPPNVLTVVCRSGASQVGHCLHLLGERFGYERTVLYGSLLLALKYGAIIVTVSRA